MSTKSGRSAAKTASGVSWTPATENFRARRSARSRSGSQTATHRTPGISPHAASW